MCVSCIFCSVSLQKVLSLWLLSSAKGNRSDGQALLSLFPAVFGQRLDETVAYEQKFGPHLVPILVEKCAEFILEHGLNEEGIFRLPGQDNLVKQLRDAFDAGERPSFERYAALASSPLCPAWLRGPLSTS